MKEQDENTIHLYDTALAETYNDKGSALDDLGQLKEEAIKLYNEGAALC